MTLATLSLLRIGLWAWIGLSYVRARLTNIYPINCNNVRYISSEQGNPFTIAYDKRVNCGWKLIRYDRKWPVCCFCVLSVKICSRTIICILSSNKIQVVNLINLGGKAALIRPTLDLHCLCSSMWILFQPDDQQTFLWCSKEYFLNY